MSGIDAVEFFERLRNCIDEYAKTPELCEEYARALNRIRYEIRKSVPIQVKKLKIRYTTYSCGQCGFSLATQYKYCPNCGRKIKWE